MIVIIETEDGGYVTKLGVLPDTPANTVIREVAPDERTCIKYNRNDNDNCRAYEERYYYDDYDEDEEEEPDYETYFEIYCRHHFEGIGGDDLPSDYVYDIKNITVFNITDKTKQFTFYKGEK